ncbi:MAG: hypothetical protein PHS86_03950 [Syntrophaceae bacterium]|nr:hypothetical protein [Syntrophaceae bacterium]
MVDQGKRKFFKRLFKETIGRTVMEFEKGIEEAQNKEKLERFFESYESSYALTLNYPDEILIESARIEGIEVEGRDKLDIARELFEKKGNFI